MSLLVKIKCKICQKVFEAYISKNRSLCSWACFRISRQAKRHPHSELTKRKISNSHLGVPMLSVRGKNHHAWKGEGASYSAKHHWIKRYYGFANHCENCGLTELDRPTKKKRYFEWANLSGKYRRERSDYIQLCVKCHINFDRGNIHLIQK